MPFGVGFLTSGEIEVKMPVSDTLKSPRLPIWILHGGDHYTVAWSPDFATAEELNQVGADNAKQFTLQHWNGLPPGAFTRVCCRRLVC